MFCLVSVVEACADVYWANIEPESIGHTKGDGSELDQNLLDLSTRPEALAIDGERA